MLLIFSVIYSIKKSLMNLKINKTKSTDIPHIIAMLREFAEQTKLAEYCKVTEESLQNVMFGENSFVEGLIALVDEIPIAYAIFFPHFASFKGQRSIYLEDIYIKPEFRNLGVGEKMLREIARFGKTQNASRIDFQVSDSNKKGINFYKKLGAVCNEDETHFKFDDKAFQRLVV
jgi:GNAT superfamily N-acetyltransferase